MERVRNDPTVAVVHLKKDNRDAAAKAVAEVLVRAVAARLFDGVGDSGRGGVDGGGGASVDVGFDVTALMPFLQDGQVAKLRSGGGGGGRDVGGGISDVSSGGNSGRSVARTSVGAEKAGARGRVSTVGVPTVASTAAAPNIHANGGGCGPLVDLDRSTQPRVLLLGESASPLPKVPGEEYGERSMWKVLDDVVDVGGLKEQAAKNRRTTQRGIAIWDGRAMNGLHTRCRSYEAQFKARGTKQGAVSTQRQCPPST